jgi:hypothetical protein
MTLRLLPPSLDLIPGYVAALKTGWSPDTSGDISGRQLAEIERDPAAFLADLTRQDGMFTQPSGRQVPRLPGRVLWLGDGEFAAASICAFSTAPTSCRPMSTDISATRWCHGNGGAATPPRPCVRCCRWRATSA